MFFLQSASIDFNVGTVVRGCTHSDITSMKGTLFEIDNKHLTEETMQSVYEAGYKGLIVVTDGTPFKEQLLKKSRVPILIKGVANKQDALFCLNINAKGIVVGGDDETMPYVSLLTFVLIFLIFLVRNINFFIYI